MGERLEETLRDLERQTTSPILAFVIISESKEEKQVERRAIEKEKQVERLVEVEQPTKISSELVEGGLFDVEVNSHDIHVVPTKSRSKCMMRHKGKEHVEEGNSFTKQFTYQSNSETNTC